MKFYYLLTFSSYNPSPLPISRYNKFHYWEQPQECPPLRVMKPSALGHHRQNKYWQHNIHLTISDRIFLFLSYI